MTTPELLAIRCRETLVSMNSSKSSESWGSTYGPQLSGLLADGTGDGGALHLTLGVDDLEYSRVSLFCSCAQHRAAYS